MTPAEDFADKCDRIMTELVEPATRQPMRVWIDESLFAVELIKRVDWEPTGADLIDVVNPKAPPDLNKSKNPFASQQAWKKKHRR